MNAVTNLAAREAVALEVPMRHPSTVDIQRTPRTVLRSLSIVGAIVVLPAACATYTKSAPVDESRAAGSGRTAAGEPTVAPSSSPDTVVTAEPSASTVASSGESNEALLARARAVAARLDQDNAATVHALLSAAHNDDLVLHVNTAMANLRVVADWFKSGSAPTTRQNAVAALDATSQHVDSADRLRELAESGGDADDPAVRSRACSRSAQLNAHAKGVTPTEFQLQQSVDTCVVWLDRHKPDVWQAFVHCAATSATGNCRAVATAASGRATAASKPTATTPKPKPSAFRASKYGAFRNVNVTDDCEIWFDRAGGTPTKLFAEKTCADTWIVRIEEVDQFGGLKLPAVAKSGEEFHILEIPSARGGNASVACDYYAVVIDGTKVWASPMFTLRECAAFATSAAAFRVSAALIDSSTTAALSFVEPETTTSVGRSFDLTMGALKITPIPAKARSIVSEKTVTRTGKISPAIHATNWKHSVYSDTESLTIDDAGKCSLDDAGESTVEVTGQLRTWSDKAVEFTCSSIRKVK